MKVIKINEVIANIEVRNESGQTIAEYDVVGVNGSKIIITEVKYRLRNSHIDRFVKDLKKAAKVLHLAQGKEIVGIIGGMGVGAKEIAHAKKKKTCSCT